MRNLKHCILIYLALTVLTGYIYPITVTIATQLSFPDKANGSLIYKSGEIRGSKLIGQNFTGAEYFWPRPSISDYSAMPSSASNEGPTSEALKQSIENRKNELAPYIGGKIPADLLMASASGLDPHISPEAALAQVDHVAEARNLSSDQKTELENLVRQHIERPQWGIFGAARVNVLELNLAVDEKFGTMPRDGGKTK